MEPLSTYIAETMYYKQVLTYNFSDNETRDSFVDLLKSMGFIEKPDQSTWALPFSSQLAKDAVISKITMWSKSKGVNIYSDDFVQIFRAVPVKIDEKTHHAGIDQKTLKYDATTGVLK